MTPFLVERATPLPVAEAWRRMTDWERHTATVPLTRITVLTEPPSGAGTAFVARTALGRVAFADPMRVTVWQPPQGERGSGHCRLVKTGRLVTGWAEIDVSPYGAGSRVRWRELLRVRGVPRLADGLTTRTGGLVFGRAVDALLNRRDG